MLGMPKEQGEKNKKKTNPKAKATSKISRSNLWAMQFYIQTNMCLQVTRFLTVLINAKDPTIFKRTISLH